MNQEQINENMKLYNKFGTTPSNAKKPIEAGRLKGMTDINPMFRIKSLTEAFGPVGFGWYYETTNKWLEQGADGVIAAFVDVNLYVKYNGEWSKPIQGTGGSTFVAKESKGLYTDDEAYKKALTDAISIACKSLGMSADIYYSKDAKYGTKYDNNSYNKPVDNSVETVDNSKKDEIDLNAKIGGNGKYKDKTWLEVYKENPTYLQWCIDNSKTEASKSKYKKILKEIKEREVKNLNILLQAEEKKEEKGQYITMSDDEINEIFNL